MPLKDCPFTECSGAIYRPILHIRLVNPHTGIGTRTYGIIDTGADECAVPASFAQLIGHNLQAGSTKSINTGNGVTIAYTHTTKFEIYHPRTGNLIYTVEDTPIDFMPNLHVVLLGVKNFLSNFILNVDYPRNLFSIKHPPKKRNP
jgi:hypothetical protein